MVLYATFVAGTTIAGCAVAQHCCKGDHPFQWETPKFDPSYFPNPLIFFTPKFAHVITSKFVYGEGAFLRISEI